MAICFIGIYVFKRNPLRTFTLDIAAGVVVKTGYVTGHVYVPGFKNALV
jgi:hypothetical protein